MDTQSTIRAFQESLVAFTFDVPESWPEGFAQKRFLKKFEAPCDAHDSELASACFSKWLDRDGSLPGSIGFLHPVWYKARARLHKALDSSFRMGGLGFTPGSSFEPTRGRNSTEAKLLGPWTCTPENFELFAKMAYSHHGFKHAVKKRFRKFCYRNSLDVRASARTLWERHKGYADTPFRCFRHMLSEVTWVVNGSRFATVPKNNMERRGINVEPSCNSLTQAAISEGLENLLQTEFAIDLRVAQDTHREMIALAHYATIDLKAASDSFSVAFMKWLLPGWFYRLVDQARSHMVLDEKGETFYVPKIFMCMGNGFCFSLMTTIFACLVRSLSEDSSVFGDDIIIPKEHSSTLIEALESASFIVNKDKSFVDGPFRESCGANYHDQYGYVRSFDFTYPETIADCMITYNKCVMLKRYPSFEKLRRTLVRLIPPVLRGGVMFLDFQEHYSRWGRDPQDSLLGQAFWAPFVKGGCPKVLGESVLALIRQVYCCENITQFYTFRFQPKLRSKTERSLRSFMWAKYFMYLSAGRVAKDVVTGEGEWGCKLFLRINGLAVEAKTVLNNLPPLPVVVRQPKGPRKGAVH